MTDPYLHRFIREFSPALLLPDKDLWLHLEENGRFVVRLGKSGEEVPCLSETDQWIFRYLCWLHRVRFWEQAGRWSGREMPKPRLLIRDFSDRLDESVDFDVLLRRAEEISHQIVLLP